MQISCLFYTKKAIFLFYIPIFTKHTHQFIYFIHLLNKIFIFFTIFYYSLPHRPSLSQTHHYQQSLHTQPPSSPPNQHHQEKPTHSIRDPVNPKSIQSQTHSSPTQPETQSSQIITHPTRNPLIIWSAWFDDRRGLCLMIWWFDWHGLMIGGWRGLMIYRWQVNDDRRQWRMIWSNDERESGVRWQRLETMRE